MRFSTRGLKAVDLGKRGLAVGFLGLKMGDGSLDYLVTASKFDHMQTRVHSGAIQLQRDANGLRISGIITPGKPALIRVAYPIPHMYTSTTLAGSWETSLTSLQLDLRSPARYIAQLMSPFPGKKQVSSDKGVVQQRYELIGALSPGEIFALKVSSLPVDNPWWRMTILALCALVGVLLVLLWFYLAKEESAPRGAEG